MKMKSISTLIKLHKKNLDEIVLKKNKAEQELQQLLEFLNILIEESKQEIEKYHNGEYAYILENYLKEFRAKKEDLESTINNYNKYIAKLESDLHNEFSELKKFEIIKKNRLAKQAEKDQKHEMDQLDELSIGGYIRNKKND